MTLRPLEGSLRSGRLLIALAAFLQGLWGGSGRGSVLDFLGGSPPRKTKDCVVEGVEKTRFEGLTGHLFLEGHGGSVVLDGGWFEGFGRTGFGRSDNGLGRSRGWCCGSVLLVCNRWFWFDIGLEHFSEFVLVARSLRWRGRLLCGGV